MGIMRLKEIAFKTETIGVSSIDSLPCQIIPIKTRGKNNQAKV